MSPTINMHRGGPTGLRHDPYHARSGGGVGCETQAEPITAPSEALVKASLIFMESEKSNYLPCSFSQDLPSSVASHAV